MGTGNPLLGHGQVSALRVYPRGHGESVERLARHVAAEGLSPWARGIRKARTAGQALMRSIPVGTGNPPRRRSALAAPGVYPRGHGESAIISRHSPIDSGLSPWARGIQADYAEYYDSERSIPVGTGNPSRRSAARCSPRVYPRGHGESG